MAISSNPNTVALFFHLPYYAVLECVLAGTKEKVLAQVDIVAVPEAAQDWLLPECFWSVVLQHLPKLDLSKLGETHIGDNLDAYVQAFSKDAREIFQNTLISVTYHLAGRCRSAL